jgi:hypothetical protein
LRGVQQLCKIGADKAGLCPKATGEKVLDHQMKDHGSMKKRFDEGAKLPQRRVIFNHHLTML